MSPSKPRSTPGPTGAHRLRVERDNFLPVAREVVLPPGGRVHEDVALRPTPAYRMLYLSGARTQRRAWMAVGGAGIGLPVVGAVLFGLHTLPALDAHSRAVEADAAYTACRDNFECQGMRLPELALTRDTAVAQRDDLRPPPRRRPPTDDIAPNGVDTTSEAPRGTGSRPTPTTPCSPKAPSRV